MWLQYLFTREEMLRRKAHPPRNEMKRYGI